jgi:glutathione S-transferase
MKLIASYTSPYARKARIICAERNIQFEMVEDNPWNADAKIRAANPLGRVPALVLANGTALFDSRVICEYLDETFPGARLTPTNGVDRYLVKRMEALGDGIVDSGIYIFLERKREESVRNIDMIHRRISQINASLDEAQKLVAGRAFAIGNSLSMADIALCAGLAWIEFRLGDLNGLKNHPALATYFAAINDRPSFVSTRPPA